MTDTMSTVATGSAPLRDLRALPKGHLHLHMEASVRPATLESMAAALGIAAPETTVFSGFTQFDVVYRTLLAVLQEPEHLARLIDEIFEDQAADGVVYLELGVDPSFYVERYGSHAAALEVMLEHAHRSSERHGVAFGFMVTIDRTGSVEDSLLVARAAVGAAGRGVVSLGLASDERGHPGAAFADAFALARAAGLQSTPHAGELVGPESIREALDVLHADRILHGVRAVEDPALVAELAERGIPLDVCPTSNLLLDVVESLDAHPLPALLAAGVRCSINADDPIIFGPQILSEYELCRATLGLSDEQLAACAWTSIETTAAPDALKQEARRRIDAWLA
ncbi:adenosine deaminase [Rathayibacter sp. Leaf296]|uniref:adenosine deaminase n=1 Tax=Rathayibacter sp. Leaf296 TaxID=1736327 RepID=UPI000AA40F3D|nr:adenosine deaminase [Rathayibacter sp. Leaf296]